MSSDTIGVSPCCDSSDWMPRSNKLADRAPAEAEPYLCRACGEPFTELVEREVRGARNVNHGIAADLVEADPDDVGGERA